MSIASLSVLRLVVRRLADDRMLLAGVFVGITTAVSIIAAAPVYVRALERLSLNVAVDELERPFSNINTFSFNIPLTGSELERTEFALEDAIDRHISPIYDRHERYLIGPTYLAGLPSHPLPESTQAGRKASRASFRSFSNLKDHVTFLEGAMAGDQTSKGNLPEVAVVISLATASMFRLGVGDEISMTPSLLAPPRLSARIVGIVRATDPTEDYWKPHASFFLNPPPVRDIDGPQAEFDSSRPPAPLFTTQEAMARAFSEAYPQALVDSIWFIYVDTERLKALPPSDMRDRLDGFEQAVTRASPGSEVLTGIRGIVNEFERRRFFSRVPLLLLLTLLAVTVLFYLSMVVSYLVKSRERDGAMLRTRGAGTLQLLRLYGLEGLAITAAAVAPAPFIATGAVALTGKLPYFSEITDGDFLPVRLDGIPFLAAMAAGLLCLSIFVIPGALGSRGGLLVEKVQTSRPPTVPFLFRYYLDVGLLALGGLVFWELNSRGHVVSGGLFKDVQVNEALLFAPVLFLVVVALVFIRLFPMVVRFISGESAALLHLVVSAMVVVLGLGIPVRETREGNGLAWLIPVALVLAVAAAYWGTSRARPLRLRLGGMIVQAGLVAVFLAVEPLDPEALLFTPTLVLVAMAPAQLAFMLLGAATRAAPVWLSMGLWRMARSPLQYTWLVLLLVLATGLGILSTTVGRTLVRSYEERVLYDVAADIRISGIDATPAVDAETLKEMYLAVPGVISASAAFRAAGFAGLARIQVLGLEAGDFPYISWYRDDFSPRPLVDVMGTLQSHARLERMTLPERATSVAVWVRPVEEYDDISLWMVLQDEAGAMTPISLGELGPPEWHLMSAEIPTRMKKPLHLVSVQIFEGGLGPVGTPGTVYLDQIHAIVGTDEEYLLDNFEAVMRWVPIITSGLTPDRLRFSSNEPYRGNRAGQFSFGRETERGIRGFYQSPTGGSLPVVVSSPVIEATGARIGEGLIAVIAGRRVPVVIMDTVEHFPTMGSDGTGFVLADLDGLLAHLNILSPIFPFAPNELFLTESPADRDAVRQAIRILTPFSSEVHDKTAGLESVRRDPMTTAGWSFLVVLSLGVVVLTTGLGYATYLLSIANRSSSEIGFLQYLGTSRRQLVGLVSFEHLTVAAMGLGLGTWAGLAISQLMVSAVAVTETGERAVPPYLLTTDWSMMAAAYAALVAVFLLSLALLSRSVQRVDVKAVSRVGGF